MPQTVAVIGAVSALAGTAGSIAQGRKADKMQKKAAFEQAQARKEEKKIAQEERRRAFVNQIRESRIANAALVSSAGSAGLTGTSTFAGGTGSITSQTSSNLGFTSRVGASMDRINMFTQNAANYTTSAQSAANKGQLFGQIASTGVSLFGAATDGGSVSSLFGNGTQDTFLGIRGAYK